MSDIDKHNKVAVSLAPPDTDTCLAQLHAHQARIGLAEVRVDQMEVCDLPRLIAEAPVPLVITCRPVREGGAFRGEEAARLAVLRRAMELGSAYVDLEWDCAGALERPPRSKTRVIVSRHWFDQTPSDLLAQEAALRPHADAVKLVGTTRAPSDLLPVLELLHRARGPVIAIGMGAEGTLTRVLAPCFGACLLTFGATAAASCTAPGQLPVATLWERYRLHQAGEHTRIRLTLAPDAAAPLEGLGTDGGGLLDLRLPADPGHGQVAAQLAAWLPERVSIQEAQRPNRKGAI
jgi:3-dehydroquinate dehydratase/shikimate dehydrogenase